MFGKNKKNSTICIENSTVKAYLQKIVRNSYEYSYQRPFFSDPQKELSYEDALLILEEVKKNLKKESLHRVIYMDYTGFSDGSDNVSYLLSKMEIKAITEVDAIIFNSRIESIEKIKEFLRRMSYEYDFLDIYLPGEIWQELKEFDVKIEDLDGSITDFKDAFFEDYEETECGIKRNSCAGIGHRYFEFICNKDDVYYNLSIIRDYVDKFKKYLLTNDKYVEDILVRVDSIEEIPYIVESKNLLVQAIANNKILASELTKENEIGNYSTKSIILKALEENPNCYCNIDAYYKKDEEIFCKAFDKNISLLPHIIDSNGFDKISVKEKIKEILIGK